jgi:hypothetical protein
MNSNSNSKAVLDEAVQKAERVLAELLEDGIGRLSKAGGPEPDGDEPPPEASGSAAPGPGGAPPGEAAGERVYAEKDVNNHKCEKKRGDAPRAVALD